MVVDACGFKVVWWNELNQTETKHSKDEKRTLHMTTFGGHSHDTPYPFTTPYCWTVRPEVVGALPACCTPGKTPSEPFSSCERRRRSTFLARTCLFSQSVPCREHVLSRLSLLCDISSLCCTWKSTNQFLYINQSAISACKSTTVPNHSISRCFTI